MRMARRNRRTRRAGFRGALGGVLVLAVTAGTFTVATAVPPFAAPRFYSDQNELITKHPNWMRWVPDDTLISELSLPGTHDTMAFTLSSGSPGKTQGMSLRNQLDAGVRVLDIRARHENDQFSMYHGVQYLGSSFDDVLTTIQGFLADNPSETLLVRLKPEHTDQTPEHGNKGQFEDTFAEYHKRFRSLFFWQSTPLTQEPQIPTLGAVRGKIVLLQNFGSRYGFYGLGWDEGTLVIQDDYEVPTLDHIDDKWEKVKRHFDAADHPGSSPQHLYINFLSGSSAGAYPYAVAGGTISYPTKHRGVNDYALEWLFPRNIWRRTGAVMMDFPGAALIDVVVAQNMRLNPQPSEVRRDFEEAVWNLAYSTKGNALSRREDLETFAEHVLPGHLWQTLVARSEHDLKVTDSEGAYGFGVDLTPGAHYFHYVWNARSGESAATASEVEQFVKDAAGSLEGNAFNRASTLRARLLGRWPGQHWAVIAKKAPGGFDNWAFRLHGVGYHHWFDDWNYTVAGYSLFNRRPTADAGGPYTVDEGTPLMFSAAGSSDPDGDGLAYRWDFESDGAWDTDFDESSSVEHVYSDDFAGRVTVEVSDGTFTATAAAGVEVRNVAPTLANDDLTTSEGLVLAEALSFADPGDDSWTATVDYGDGSPPESVVVQGRTVPVSHRYVESGRYILTLTVSDDDGGVGRDAIDVEVANVAPTVRIQLPASVDEGRDVVLTGTVSDPSPVDPVTVTVDWGESPSTTLSLPPSAGSQPFRLTRQYVDDDPSGTPADEYTVTAAAHDDDGGVSTDSASVLVRNVAPVVAIDAVVDQGGNRVQDVDDGVLVHTPVALHATYRDAGTRDTHRYVIDWGDSSSDTGVPAGGIARSHTYTSSGTHTVVVAVEDDDGGTGTAQMALKVLTPREAVVDAIAHVDALLAAASNGAVAHQLQAARRDLDGDNGGRASNGALDKLYARQFEAALVMLGKAAEHLQQADSATTADLGGLIDELALIGRSAVVGLIDAAEQRATRANDWRRVAEARGEVKRGDEHLASGDVVGALKAYRLALAKV